MDTVDFSRRESVLMCLAHMLNNELANTPEELNDIDYSQRASVLMYVHKMLHENNHGQPDTIDYSQRASVLMCIQNMLDENNQVRRNSAPILTSSLAPFFCSIDTPPPPSDSRDSVIMNDIDYSRRASVLMYIQNMLSTENGLKTHQDTVQPCASVSNNDTPPKTELKSADEVGSFGQCAKNQTHLNQTLKQCAMLNGFFCAILCYLLLRFYIQISGEQRCYNLN